MLLCNFIILQVWLSENLFSDTFQFYKNYRIPKAKKHNDIMEFIESLPNTDSPEAMGLHPNADIT